MYRTGQEIEYANGLQATVVAVPSEGTQCADGAFVIRRAEGFALCWLDMECEEAEAWSFVDEAAPWRPTLEEALATPYA
jgi:hypothetical protein